jgi:hypothetical protein
MCSKVIEVAVIVAIYLEASVAFWVVFNIASQRLRIVLMPIHVHSYSRRLSLPFLVNHPHLEDVYDLLTRRQTEDANPKYRKYRSVVNRPSTCNAWL